MNVRNLHKINSCVRVCCTVIIRLEFKHLLKLSRRLPTIRFPFQEHMRHQRVLSHRYWRYRLTGSIITDFRLASLIINWNQRLKVAQLIMDAKPHFCRTTLQTMFMTPYQRDSCPLVLLRTATWSWDLTRVTVPPGNLLTLTIAMVFQSKANMSTLLPSSIHTLCHAGVQALPTYMRDSAQPTPLTPNVWRLRKRITSIEIVLQSPFKPLLSPYL